jgi:hypothetical protein
MSFKEFSTSHREPLSGASAKKSPKVAPVKPILAMQANQDRSQASPSTAAKS